MRDSLNPKSKIQNLKSYGLFPLQGEDDGTEAQLPQAAQVGLSAVRRGAHAGAEAAPAAT
jgi:hypothetical protein